MTGYKVYFNGKKFVADNKESEIVDVPIDSTVCWYGAYEHAKTGVCLLNKRISEVKKCKDCGGYFMQTDSEARWLRLTERDLKPTVRCARCRDKRKK